MPQAFKTANSAAAIAAALLHTAACAFYALAFHVRAWKRPPAFAAGAIKRTVSSVIAS
jgi:hypothetical protein